MHLSDVGWDADPVVASRAGLPPLEGSITADVCVIGLGGSGLAAVGEAVRRGLSVVGLDAGRVAAGAAGRNGGFLIAGPAIALHQAAADWEPGAAVDLYRQTMHEIDALAELLGHQIIRRQGSLRLAGLPGKSADDAEAADRKLELADCLEQERALREYGIAVERYEGPLGSGLFLPDDAAMNPARRALGLAELYGAPARLFENSPVHTVGSGQVNTDGGTVSAGLVVVAVDGKLEVLLPELTGRVRTTRLQMLSTEPLAPRPSGEPRLPCPVYSRWGYDYAQQDTAGRMFIGGGRDQAVDEEWTLDTTPTATVQGWIEHAAVRFAGAPVRVTHRWAASAGYTPDARALVTEVRPGVVACGGYNGTGNLVGPIAARAALALGLDGQRPGNYFAS